MGISAVCERSGCDVRYWVYDSTLEFLLSKKNLGATLQNLTFESCQLQLESFTLTSPRQQCQNHWHEIVLQFCTK
jgi:hypothetical protein